MIKGTGILGKHFLAILLAATCVAGGALADEQGVPSRSAEDLQFIDRFIFAKMARDKITPAPASTDSEFIHRLYLDLTGKLPEAEVARKFVADASPNKRTKLIESLIPALPVAGMRSIATDPFLDRWAYFFNDLFRNGQLLGSGINTFYDYIYRSLLLNVPYDETVRELITASTLSTWADGPANFVARSHVFEGDGYMMNQEDTDDELAIRTTKLFLGVNIECISCHDGRNHLEKINLWLTRHKRGEMMRQASFFGKTFISPAYGRLPQFLVKDTRKGYDPSSVSSLRPHRNAKEDVSPTFILDGSRPKPGERDREAYARMITTNPQFARATVNLIWEELMGRGIVDQPFDFDLDRQDPKNPPPSPWAIQPSHPQLLNALADDFRTSGHDLRRLIRMIVSSRAYQLSSTYPGKWKQQYEPYFARHTIRRLSAEQVWDAIAQVTGNRSTFKVSFSPESVTSVMQTHSPQDVEKVDKHLYRALQAFGQCDRYVAEADRKPNMVQTAILLNGQALQQRIQIKPESRVGKLLKATPPASGAQIIDELFWAALSRPPVDSEREIALGLLDPDQSQGIEDVTWTLVNRLDFLFY